MIKNVLIIDDCLEIQILLKFLLESRGYHVECSSNGEEALKRLDVRKDLPDLILLDLQMPIMDGLSFLNIRKKIPMLKNIPVVLMSGEDDVLQTGQSKNVDDVLQKPFTIKSVVQAVEHNFKLH
jgi:CheY-like chemotaxis protein